MSQQETKPMTGYERIKLARKIKLETSQSALEEIANRFEGKSHYISQMSFMHGIEFALKEIEGTIAIHKKAHEELKPHYTNPKESVREFDNLLRTLECLKQSLENRKNEVP